MKLYMQTRFAGHATTIALLALMGSAVACSSDDLTNPNDDIATSIQTDAHIFGVMHTSNVGEISAGQLAVQKATNTQVKSFAQMMIDDHTALDQQGTALAAQLGIAPALPDQRLPNLQAAEMTALNAAAATSAFDRVYIAQQIADHERTLGLVDASLARATRPEIVTMLQQARPKIAAHLDMARSIQGTIGQP